MVHTLFRTYLQANRSNNIIALSLSLRLPLGTKRYSCRWSWTTRTTTTYYSSLWWWPSDLIAIVDVAVINAGVVSLPLFHIIPWYEHWIPAHSHNYAGRVCSPPTHYTMSMPIYNHYCPPTKPTSLPTYYLLSISLNLGIPVQWWSIWCCSGVSWVSQTNHVRVFFPPFP